MSFAPITAGSIAASLAGLAAFVAALFAASLIVPGPVGEGAPRDGRPVRYRLNGLAIFFLTLAAVALVQSVGPGLAPLARHVWSLLIAANLLAWPAALVLVLTARRREDRSIAGYFLGADRDPSLWGVDLKLFSYRPSLIGLTLMNLSFAAWQWEETGRLTLAMALYQAFTLIYVLNYFHFEDGMLFTWDIIEERFGWMLVWGDYVLVPFFYCLPAFYVAARPDPMPPWVAALLIALFVAGLWLFRGANGQKHRFKRSPRTAIWGRPAKSIGDGRLLISGFWGIGRKLNYTGELLAYLAWTLAAGFHSPTPYLLPAWLAGLLIHRAARDDRRCREKYGSLWEDYCQHARFRMFPFIY